MDNLCNAFNLRNVLKETDAKLKNQKELNEAITYNLDSQKSRNREYVAENEKLKQRLANIQVVITQIKSANMQEKQRIEAKLKIGKNKTTSIYDIVI